MEHTDTKNRSLMRAPSGFIPSGVSFDEARWLTKILELDFNGRDIILRQIRSSRVSRLVDSESVELIFEDVGNELMLDCSGSFIVSINVLRKLGARINADLYSFNGKVDSLYVYMPDKSDLDLSVSFDDVGYEVMQFLRDARCDLTNAFHSSGAGAEDGLRNYLFNMAARNKANVAAQMNDLTDELSGTIEASLGPLSLAARIPLGSMDGRVFDAVAQHSLVGNYFTVYVLERGHDSRYPIDGITSGYFENYPGGIIVEKLRKFFYERGCKPLTPSQLRSEIEFDDVRGIRKYKLIECLFADCGMSQQLAVASFGE